MSALNASRLAIISAAFVRLGESPITSNNDPRIQSTVANSTYDLIRQAKLEDFRWSFALRLQTESYIDLTSQSVGDEDYSNQYAYAYQKPLKSLRIVGIESTAPFITSSKYIWTDDDQASILYVRDVDAPEINAGFALALSYELSGEWAKPVTDKDTQVNIWLSKADEQWKMSRHNNAKEKTPLQLLWMRLLDSPSRRRVF